MRNENEKIKNVVIRDNEAYVEGNLIDIPFFYFYNFKKETIKERRESNERLAINNSRPIIAEYFWQDSKGNQKGIKITGPPETGVPGEYEYNVLMALLYLYSQQNNQLTITDGRIENLSPEISFNFTDISKKLGHKVVSGENIRRIKEAIRNLMMTTITEIHEDSLYKKGQGKSEEVLYHILEYTKLSETKSIGENRVTGIVKINGFFFENLCNSYFKIIDYESYIKLKSIIARRLYLILSKWQKPAYLKYETLYNRIPLVEGQNFKKNQNIRNAAQQLVDIGYLSGFEAGKDGINFIFNSDKDKTPILSKEHEMRRKNKLKPYDTIADIKNGLKAFYFTDSEIEEIFKTTEMNYLKALLRYADTRRMGGTINKNEKNFVLKGLNKGYEIDQKYYE